MAAQSDLEGMPSFGRYEPKFRIAAGGMAEVYGAIARGAEGFERWVALKRMLHHVSEDPRFEEMFLDEGRLAAQIVSPHAVSTLDLGRASDGSAFLVMDLVIGATLSQIARAAQASGGIPRAVAVEIIAQAALGLHDAHEARSTSGEPLDIVHRDVSPQNILVGTDGRARISDFGIARAAQRESHTRTGEVKGKLAYFSPEQAAADEVDRRTDLFSLGIIAWEVLAGKRLFQADNPLGVLKRVVEMPIPSLDEIVPGTPRPLAAAVARALERDREKRWPTGAAFAAALRDSIAEPTPDIGAFVALHAAPTVERMISGMRSVTPSTSAAVSDVRTVEMVTTPASLHRAERADAETLAMATRSMKEQGELSIDVSMSTLATVPRQRKRPTAVWVSLAVVLTALGLLVAWWSAGRSPVASPGDVAPITAASPSAAPSAPAREPEPAVVAPSVPSVGSEAGAPARNEVVASGRRARRQRPVVPAPAAVHDAEPRAPAAVAVSPQPQPAAPVPPPSAPAQPTPRGLLNMDEFERTLQPPRSR